jgi:uncharacterized protein (DUF305 family)
MPRNQQRNAPARSARRAAAVAVVVAGLSVVAGCGSDSDAYDDADVTYATAVTSHHAQTLQVLDLSLGRQTLDPDLGALADETRQRLFAEVDVTQTWLEKNDQPVPKTALQHTHSDETTYDTTIPGILTEDRLHRLEKTSDRHFQAAWLDALITQEEGAVELARAAVDDARNAAIVKAAEADLEHHRAQLARLQELATA